MLSTTIVENFFQNVENFVWFFVGNCGEMCNFEANFKKKPLRWYDS